MFTATVRPAGRKHVHTVRRDGEPIDTRRSDHRYQRVHVRTSDGACRYTETSHSPRRVGWVTIDITNEEETPVATTAPKSKRTPAKKSAPAKPKQPPVAPPDTTSTPRRAAGRTELTKTDVRKSLDAAKQAAAKQDTPKAPRERKPSSKAKPVTYDAEVRYPGWGKHAKQLDGATDRDQLHKAIFEAVVAGYPVTLIGGHITMNQAQVHSTAVAYAKRTDQKFPTLEQRKAARDKLRPKAA